MIPRKYQVISRTLIQISKVLLSSIFPGTTHAKRRSDWKHKLYQRKDTTDIWFNSFSKVQHHKNFTSRIFSHYLLIPPIQVPFSFSSFRGQSYEDRELLRLSGPNSSTITRTIKLEASGLQLKLAFLWNSLFWQFHILLFNSKSHQTAYQITLSLNCFGKILKINIKIRSWFILKDISCKKFLEIYLINKIYDLNHS